MSECDHPLAEVVLMVVSKRSRPAMGRAQNGTFTFEPTPSFGGEIEEPSHRWVWCRKCENVVTADPTDWYYLTGKDW
jgi:hypothetical protein